MTLTANILLLGSGELGREFVISAKRLGCHVVACDSYPAAPAMQVADAFANLIEQARRLQGRAWPHGWRVERVWDTVHIYSIEWIPLDSQVGPSARRSRSGRRSDRHPMDRGAELEGRRR